MTSDAARISAEQSEFWNSEAAQTWVRHQQQLDRQLTPATDLLLDQAEIRPAERIIDIGCGTGAVSRAAARLSGPSGRILGLDISASMLDGARRATPTEPDAAPIEFVQADAQSHALEEGAFDLVLSRFGVMFFGDPVAAFSNLRRALTGGGRLCFACWGPLEHNPWFAIPRAAIARHIGPPPAPVAHAPGPMAFAEANHVQGLLADAGLTSIEIAARAVDLIGAPDAAATADFLTQVGPAARAIRTAKAAPETIAAMVADMTAALAPHQRPDGIRVPALINYVVARNANRSG